MPIDLAEIKARAADRLMNDQLRSVSSWVENMERSGFTFQLVTKLGVTMVGLSPASRATSAQMQYARRYGKHLLSILLSRTIR